MVRIREIPSLCDCIIVGKYVILHPIKRFLSLYRAYLDKIKAQGFKGDELTKQLVKFYRGYSNFWRAKYTADYAEAVATGKYEPIVSQDNHSLEKERINGIVPNTNAWYELFNVKKSDKLYIAPEDRIHIW